jgi:hypothetical protein
VSTHILQNTSQLIFRGRFFCYIEVELGTLRVGLMGMVASLVVRRILSCIGRCLFEEGVDTNGSRGAGFVEESYDIESFVLEKSLSMTAIL